MDPDLNKEHGYTRLADTRGPWFVSRTVPMLPSYPHLIPTVSVPLG